MGNQTILERIRNAKKYLGVSRRELEKEITEYWRVGDKQGIKELFEAYRDWEVHLPERKKSVRETIILAKENLDLVCHIADTRLENEVEQKSLQEFPMLKSSLNSIDVKVGKIREFYREAIGYYNKSNN